ncbi:hypothetical protein [Agrobacterium tumefaciens]|uniref:hypothetical protein n=1 Tax=Agrobacterium tumefaciens TaxID=358 RepID=UPI0015724C1B|nr:hypothetical protein [Agrobacterium tumefaciens]WCK03475.1 hypothetical protein G6L31_006490 [Agrobacterium tumefaciens]
MTEEERRKRNYLNACRIGFYTSYLPPRPKNEKAGLVTRLHHSLRTQYLFKET